MVERYQEVGRGLGWASGNSCFVYIDPSRVTDANVSPLSGPCDRADTLQMAHRYMGGIMHVVRIVESDVTCSLILTTHNRMEFEEAPNAFGRALKF